MRQREGRERTGRPPPAPAPAARSPLGRMVGNTVWLLAGKGVGAVLSLVYLGLATRTLGPRDFGQFVLALGTGQTISALVRFQTWQLIVRYGMEHQVAGDVGKVGRLISFAGALDLLSAVVGSILAVAAVVLLGPVFGWNSALRWQALLFCIVMLLSIRSTPVGILRLHDRFAIGAVADAVTPVVRLTGALAAVALEARIAGFLYAWAAAEIATSIAYWISAAHFRTGTVRWLDLRQLQMAVLENPRILRFAATSNMGVTLSAAGKQFTVVIIGFFVGPVAAGTYRLAYQLGQALATVSEQSSRAMFSEMARARYGAAEPNIARLFRNGALLSVALAGIIVALLIIFGKPALTVVAGHDYAAAYPLMVILGTAAAIDLAGVGHEPALMATDHPGLALRLRAMSTAILLTLLVVLLPIFGVKGAAVAILISSAAAFVTTGAAAWRAVHSARPAETLAIVRSLGGSGSNGVSERSASPRQVRAPARTRRRRTP